MPGTCRYGTCEAPSKYWKVPRSTAAEYDALVFYSLAAYGMPSLLCPTR